MLERTRDHVLPAHLREAARDVLGQARALVLPHRTIQRTRLHEVVVFAMAYEATWPNRAFHGVGQVVRLIRLGESTVSR